MIIGSFAGTSFEVSSGKVLTFSDFTRSGSSRWAVHEINLQKPLPEFIGEGQQTITFKIVSKTTHNVSPYHLMERLRAFRNQGKVSTLIVGDRPVTNGFWYLEDIQEQHRHIDQKGVVHTIEASLTLKEYPKEKPIRNKPKPESPAAKTPAKKSATTGTMTVTVGMLNCRMSPSLNGKIKKVLHKNDSFKVYGTVESEGITWYVLGGGVYASAGAAYSTFKKT